MTSAVDSFLIDSREVTDGVKGFTREQFHSAKCFISIQFSNGLFQREFVVKNLGNAMFDKAALSQKMQESLDRIQAEVDPVFGAIKESHWLLVVKDVNDILFHKMVLDRSSRDFSCSTSGPVLVAPIDFAYQNFIHAVHYPEKPLLQNGNFV